MTSLVVPERQPLLGPKKRVRSSRYLSVKNTLSPIVKEDLIHILSPLPVDKESKRWRIKSTTTFKENAPTQSRIIMFVVALVVYHIFTGMLLYAVKAYATTIERRYGLSSSMIGLIVSGCDIGYFISIVPVALATSRLPRPRIIAFGGLTMAIGGLIGCLPQFLCGKYDQKNLHRYHEASTTPGVASNSFVPQLCNINTSIATEHQQNSVDFHLIQELVPSNHTIANDENPEICSKRYIESIFMFSTLLIGAGSGPVATLHFSYIDDISPSEKSPIYLAAVQTFGVIGVLLSYGLAGFVSNLYVDFGNDSPMHILMKPGDVNWVGAWWLGLVIPSVGAVVTCFPLFFFNDDTKHDDVEDDDVQPIKSAHNSGCNPIVYITGNLILIATVLCNIGWNIQPLTSGTFVLKYIQQEFLMSVSSSSLTVGAIIWLPTCIGIPIGAYIHSKFQWNTHQIAIYIAVLMALSSIYYPAGCPNHDIIGLNNNNEVEDTCVTNCGCANEISSLRPVCGSDSRTYATPCRAGCTTMTSSAHFGDCKCISSYNGEANDGFCRNECSPIQFGIFIGNFIARMLLICMSYIPYNIFIMRIVKPTDKAIAIAIKEIVGRLFGEIPGNLIAGKMFDFCCLFWSTEESGGCQLYDLNRLRMGYFWLSVIPSLFSLIAFVVAILLTKNKPSKDIPHILVENCDDDDVFEDQVDA